MRSVAAGLAAGFIAIVVTRMIEHWGGRKGGLLGTLPTTIVPAALGFWAEDPDPERFRDAMAAVPFGMTVNALFLGTWRILPPKLSRLPQNVALLLMSLLSLSVWAVAATFSRNVLIQGKGAGFSSTTLGLLALVSGLGLGIMGILRSPPAPTGARAVGPWTLLARGLLAATAVGGSVVLARYADPTIAGLASAFPAIFLTSMVSLWISQGRAVQGGAVGPMMLGSSSVSGFALLAGWLFPALGASGGTLAAWLLAVGGITFPAWKLLLYLSRRSAQWEASQVKP
jgi:hypothetical protein